jgi:ribosomal protein S18 acetylase RimI-like enzyme
VGSSAFLSLAERRFGFAMSSTFLISARVSIDGSSPMTLRELRGIELEEAARIVGCGMRDNPANVRAFGIEDAERRSRALVRFFRPVLFGLRKRGVILGAFRDGTLEGVCGMARPGVCQSKLLEKVSVVPSLIFRTPVGTSLRVLSWVSEWARRDPAEPHWHLGPVAVDPRLRGQGIGGAMLAHFCRRMDDCAALSYLETDKSENVGFYEKFGFTVVAEAKVLGVPNWFISRPPRPAAKNAAS